MTKNLEEMYSYIQIIEEDLYKLKEYAEKNDMTISNEIIHQIDKTTNALNELDEMLYIKINN